MRNFDMLTFLEVGLQIIFLRLSFSIFCTNPPFPESVLIIINQSNLLENISGKYFFSISPQEWYGFGILLLY